MKSIKVFGLVNILLLVFAISSFAFTVDFSSYSIESYGGSQDAGGSATVSPDGSTLELIGNTWKYIDLTSNPITSDTYLSFEFKSTEIAEIQGIGLDNNSGSSLLSSDTAFQLYGEQTWGIQVYNNLYDPTNGWAYFSIPIGIFSGATLPYLLFINDDDDALGTVPNNTTSNSSFRNIQITEGAPVPEPATLLLLGSGIAGLAFYRRKRK